MHYQSAPLASMSLTVANRFPSLKPAFENARQFVGLYFASSWCPDCAPVTSALKALYENQPSSADEPKDLEIVYISSDKSKEQMEASMSSSHGSWHAIPFENTQERNDIKTFFGIWAAAEMTSLNLSRQDRVDGIPSLVIVDAETEQIVTTNGMAGLNKYGPTDVYHVWLSKKDQLTSRENKHDSNY